jgi:hypothetical protein
MHPMPEATIPDTYALPPKHVVDQFIHKNWKLVAYMNEILLLMLPFSTSECPAINIAFIIYRTCRLRPDLAIYARELRRLRCLDYFSPMVILYTTLTSTQQMPQIICENLLPLCHRSPI